MGARGRYSRRALQGEAVFAMRSGCFILLGMGTLVKVTVLVSSHRSSLGVSLKPAIEEMERVTDNVDDNTVDKMIVYTKDFARDFMREHLLASKLSQA